MHLERKYSNTAKMADERALINWKSIKRLKWICLSACLQEPHDMVPLI